MNNKTIMNYFDSTQTYPENILHEMLPYGTLWEYVSVDLLNGFVNYGKPLKICVCDRYRTPDYRLDNEYNCTKIELISKIQNNELTLFHTNLRIFNDDIILLQKFDASYKQMHDMCEIDDVEYDELRNMGHYILYWFDCDTSDCMIGKFRTTDSEEKVIESFDNYIKDLEFECYNLPLNFLNGWLKF